jgi:hypothetical protein
MLKPIIGTRDIVRPARDEGVARAHGDRAPATWMAWIDQPRQRLTVAHAELCGNPERSLTPRPILSSRSASGKVQPHIMSSTSPPRTPMRSSSERIAGGAELVGPHARQRDLLRESEGGPDVAGDES